MEPPTKRLKLGTSLYSDDEENQDELSMTPVQFNNIQDPLYQLEKKRAKSATRLKSAFESLFEKYGKASHGTDDVINFYTDEIEEDNGHVKSLEDAGLDLLSSDEEDNTGDAKTGGNSQSKPRRKPSISRGPIGDNPPAPFRAPWSTSLNLGNYQSPPFARPPYSVNPPFDFGGALFGNGQVDPVWQAPDLPIQPLYTQHGSLSDMGRTPMGTKRLVNAKAFLQKDTSNTVTGGDGSEDDELLLASDENQASSSSIMKSPERPSIDSSNSGAGAGVQAMPPGSARPNKDVSEPNTIQNQEAKPVLNSPSPRRGRGRPRKQERPTQVLDVNRDLLRDEQRVLQAHERRIEVIIPRRRHILHEETGDVASVCATIPATGSLSGPHPNAPDGTSSEEAKGPGSACSIQDEGHEDRNLSEPKPRMLRKRRRSHRRQQTGSPDKGVLPECEHDKGNTELKYVEDRPKHATIGDSPHGNTVVEDMPTEDTPTGDSRSGQDDATASDNKAPIANAPEKDVDQISPITTDKVIEPIPNNDSVSKPPRQLYPEEPREVEYQGTVESPRSAGFEFPVPEDTQYDLEAFNGNEPNVFLVDHRGDGSSDAPAHMVWSNAPQEVNICDAVQLSERAEAAESQAHSAEADIGLRSPELPALGKTMENASPRSLGPHTIADVPDAPVSQADRSSPEKALPVSVLLSELNDLRLGSESGARDYQRSPSLGATEPSGGTGVTYELDLPLSSLPTDENAHCQQEPGTTDVHIHSRSPSPELGTPTRSQSQPSSDRSRLRASPAASPTKKSPRRNLNHTPTTPTKRRGRTPRSPGSKSRRTGNEISNRYRTPTSLLPSSIDDKGDDENSARSSKAHSPLRHSSGTGGSSRRRTLLSLLPSGIDDESDDELSIVTGSVRGSARSSRAPSPYRTGSPSSYSLPPLPPPTPTSKSASPRKKTRKNSPFFRTPTLSPSRILGLDDEVLLPPATDSRVGRTATSSFGESLRGRSAAADTSPLARALAQRLLLSSSPTRKQKHRPSSSSTFVDESPASSSSPNGTRHRRCGVDGLVCGREFCFTCCV
ncbi:hypothetical protein F5Y17DRAFT_415582 [Xylariaceae sp. FL0594]|nr:hypothetical protein F5Y17DRAFT_415582 [Xylariaceae sp. FL0594]